MNETLGLAKRGAATTNFYTNCARVAIDVHFRLSNFFLKCLYRLPLIRIVIPSILFIGMIIFNFLFIFYFYFLNFTFSIYFFK